MVALRISSSAAMSAGPGRRWRQLEGWYGYSLVSSYESRSSRAPQGRIGGDGTCETTTSVRLYVQSKKILCKIKVGEYKGVRA
jgi:hypothetical protein